jgi:hypothetical protein
MNPSYEAIPANCSLRRARAEDDEFLRRLFAETQDSIQAFRMNPVLFQQLAEMQYHGRRQSYQAEHPQSVDTILCVHTEEVGELPVGRLLVDCRPDCWRVVDIALCLATRERDWEAGLLPFVCISAARKRDGSSFRSGPGIPPAGFMNGWAFA